MSLEENLNLTGTEEDEITPLTRILSPYIEGIQASLALQSEWATYYISK